MAVGTGRRGTIAPPPQYFANPQKYEFKNNDISINVY